MLLTETVISKIKYLWFALPMLKLKTGKIYSKTCVKWQLSKRPKMVIKTNYRLMQVKSIAECSNVSILQYFQPALSYHLSLRSLFCLFLSDCFTQVLL